MRNKGYILIILLLQLFRCSNPGTAGGTGTETINTFVACSNGAPAVGATVKIIDAEGWADSIRKQASPVIDSTRVGDNGVFSLRMDPKRVINVQIDNGTAGGFLQYVSANQFDNDTLVLDTVHSFKGFIDSSEDKDISFRLAGTTYEFIYHSPGEINLSGIPSGTYTLVAAGSSTNWRPLVVKGLKIDGTASTPEAISFSHNRLLLDDFESGIGPTTISNLYRGIYWYAYSDGGAQGWSEIDKNWVPVPNSVPSIGTSRMEVASAEDGKNGKAALFRATLDHSVSIPWAGAGFYFNPAPNGSVDLSDLRSFTLRAKGKGTVIVRLETIAYDTLGSGYSQFSAMIYLTDAWQEHTVNVESLNLILPLDTPEQFIPWQEAAKNATKFEFEFSGRDNIADSAELYLDDIYLNGVGTERFAK